MDPRDYYLSRKTVFEERLNSVKKKSARVGALRLLTLAAGVYFLVKAIRIDYILLYPAAILLIILFILLVVYHRNLKNFSSVLRQLITINDKELQALDGNFRVFEDGREFLDIHHEFTYDLDIFGRSSLFQYINRSCTLEGKKYLAGLFTSSPLPAETIKDHQDVFTELAENPDFMQKFLSHGSLTGDEPGEKEEIEKWLHEKTFRQRKFTRWTSIILAVINTGILIAGIFSPPVFNLFYITVPLSWIFYGAHAKEINRYHNSISRKQNIMSKYLELNRIISAKKFQSAKLNMLCRNCESSLKEFKKLERLINYLDARLNLLVGVILNSLFLFDLHIIYRLEKWKAANSSLGNTFFDVPAKMDAYISLAVFRFNHPSFPMPAISNKRLYAKDIAHPLILTGKRVSNDFYAEEKNRVFIITGANMAGKSTFLRTLGVNMILAGMGAPVCAASMEFKPVKVITGMRTTDSLAESESYFFAELKRLQHIVHKLDEGENLMILLDEILKGTNSNDKHKGSLALVKRLADLDCLSLIATHDISLGEEEKNYPEKVKNYCFESYIKNGELLFDYKLKKGVASNMNAYFLMNKMGIVGEEEKQ